MLSVLLKIRSTPASFIKSVPVSSLQRFNLSSAMAAAEASSSSNTKESNSKPSQSVKSTEGAAKVVGAAKVKAKGPQVNNPPRIIPNLEPYAAFSLVKSPKKPRGFDESVDVAVNLILDTKKANQQLRVMADLPHGTGKTVKMVFFSNDPSMRAAAKASGVDIVGSAELITGIQTGNVPLNFEKSLASDDIVKELGKIAKILGPRGLMPSKKLGSVVNTVEQVTAAIERAKAGAIELRADRTGVVRCAIGKVSMPVKHLVDNLKAVILCMENNKPVGIKGKTMIKSLFVKSSMGSTVEIMTNSVDPKHQLFFAAPASLKS